MRLTEKAKQDFIKIVRGHYYSSGRHDLPWRQTQNPYHILVSEVMLQQTQVVRVIPKYQIFLHQFPNTKRLAEAPLGDVLRAWQGLGYNRRAKYLQQAAVVVHQRYRGRWPRSAEALRTLPGIGPYTAGAVAAFAYNEAIPIIETNIRTVFLHHFFPSVTTVPEAELLKLVTDTLDHSNPREWYWALMDYGTHLKQYYGNQNHRAANYTKQSRFNGSNRQLRGAVIRWLSSGPLSRADLLLRLKVSAERGQGVLAGLCAEGLLVCDDTYCRLP
jgi:A/G-specific adenine glycosylase